jgi:dTDP-4-dehydrorhamnose reductase
MRIVVTGLKGQVVQSLKERAGPDGAVTVIAIGRPDLDLAIPDTIATALERARPDIVVNAAAYTAVDRAESEAELALTINRDGAAATAHAAASLDVPFIQISTDYVFSGEKPMPYVETDEARPLGIYGRSKLAGEVAVTREHPAAIILRTGWVYSTYGTNFVKTMLRLAGERERLRVVDDQIGNPTSALDIADGIIRVAHRMCRGPRLRGIYHMSGTGEATWCGLARHVFAVSRRLGGPSVPVEPISTADYPTPARRPRNSRLDSTRLSLALSEALPDWQDSVERCVSSLIESGRNASLQ